MKRVITDAVAFSTRSKKPRLVASIDVRGGTPTTVRGDKKSWVAATHIRNWFRDPIIDYFEYQNRRGTRTTPAYTHSGGFETFIQKKGIEFESELVKYISNNRIPVSTGDPVLSDVGCEKVISLMKQGVPLIHCAPLINSDNTGGIADLLVRSDWIDKLVDECPITDEEKYIPSPLLGGVPYHYLIVDIKFSTLPLRADGKLLLNSDHYPAYKAQTWIYTQAVGDIQGYTPRYAFIMGRRWRYTSKDVTYNNFTCLNKLGVIDYQGVDKPIISQTKEAINWVRLVHEHSHEWSIDPPSRPELYPNMCIDAGKWNSEKSRLALKNGEITSIWYCGVNHRNTGLSKQITSWRDPNCTTDTLGIKGTRAPIIDAIMSINRQNKDKIRPQIITSDIYDWKNLGNEVYVDFETLPDFCSDFKDLPNQKSTNIIFMIGIGRIISGKWTYKQFLASEPTRNEEFRIMDDFAAHISELKDPKIYFWHAEQRFWKSAEDRLFNIAHSEQDHERKDRISDTWQIQNWCDLSTLFRQEPIVIKGCFNYGLKDIAKSMRSHGMISTVLDSECDSGLVACIKAWECYTTKHIQDELGATPVMKDISKYNEFDTRVLSDIHSYLVRNHSS